MAEDLDISTGCQQECQCICGGEVGRNCFFVRGVGWKIFFFFEATTGKLLNIWGVRLVVWGLLGPVKGPGVVP